MIKINSKQILLATLLCITPFLLTACTKTSDVNLEKSKIKSEFPVPQDVKNVTNLDNSVINFQTKLGIKESMDFYKSEFTKLNLTERTITTSVTDTTFSMVFDGSSNGQAIVVQGVTIENNTNISIRYEKI